MRYHQVPHFPAENHLQKVVKAFLAGVDPISLAASPIFTNRFSINLNWARLW